MIALGLLLTALLGWLCLPRRMELGPIGGLSLGFLAMSFGLSVELFLFSLVGLPLNAWLAVLPWIVTAGWSTVRSAPKLINPVSTGSIVAAVVTGVVLLVWLPMERAMPLHSQSWDAWAIWLFKAKAFYLDGSISSYLTRAGEFTGQPGYPLLTPLYSTWLYDWAGEVADHGAKLASPCYFFATIGATWWIAKRLAGPTVAGIASSLVALTPMVQRTAFDWAGYADTALSAYFVVAAGFLVLWLRDGDSGDLVAGAIAATAAAWAKNEGQVYLAVFAVIALIVIVGRRMDLKLVAWVLTPPALLLGTWYFLRASHDVEAAGFVLGAGFNVDLFVTATAEIAARVFSVTRFALVFPLFVIACLVAGAQKVAIYHWAPCALVLAHFAAVLLAYATGRNEIGWWIETSADRVVAQIAPLAIVASTVVASPWLEDAFTSAPVPDDAPPAAPAPTRNKGKKQKQRTR